MALLIEDAQYADSGLLDFLDHLIDWVSELPMFVLVFARPELGRVRPAFGAGRNRSMLTLDPLDPASMDELVDALVPEMPPAARAAVISHAQGLPLFAVETVRSLIDRDIVQPVDGVYRLIGDVGELAVPDSLHSLLAARLDALDPGVRGLMSDAVVLGSTFPAEALIAVSGRDESSVRSALADLVRREVLSVSADPLSPERGSYRFAQQMLRQVAYETLSRRDRKTRHLAVAAHLRATFAADGEEMADVIAQHYLDALNAIPDDPDAADIRGQAVAELIRAGERAERTGAPARGAASYAAAADQVTGRPARGATGRRDAEGTRRHGRHRQYGLCHGRRPRRSVRVLTIFTTGRTAPPPAPSPSPGGHCACGADTPKPVISSLPRSRSCAPIPMPTWCALWRNSLSWRYSADLPMLTGSPPRPLSSVRPLTLAPSNSAGCCSAEGSTWAPSRGGRRRSPTAAKACDSPPWSATTFELSRALVNLSDVLAVTDPAAAAEAARTAVGHLRLVGLQIPPGHGDHEPSRGADAAR